MAEQIAGTLELLNTSSNLPTVVLEGGDDEGGGNLTLGGHGQTGDLTLRDDAGRQRVFASASGGASLTIHSELGAIVMNLYNGNGYFSKDVRIGGILNLCGIDLTCSLIQTIVALPQQINDLKQRIAELERHVAALQPSGPTDAGEPIHAPHTRPNITVEQSRRVSGGVALFTIMGSGFTPSEEIELRVVNLRTQYTTKRWDHAQLNGEIFLGAVEIGNGCLQGDDLRFAATDKRQDINDTTGWLWSHPVVKKVI
jgi:hypothetical protein